MKSRLTVFWPDQKILKLGECPESIGVSQVKDRAKKQGKVAHGAYPR